MSITEFLRKILLNSKKNEEEIDIQFYDTNIQQRIIEQISKSKNRIWIATAWFTAENLLNKLLEKQEEGVDVRVIIDENDINCNSQLGYNRINIFKMINKPKNKNSRYFKMHNKYCIIDENIVIDGSYNWTNNAENNDEHIVIIKSREIVEVFEKNYNDILNR